MRPLRAPLAAVAFLFARGAGARVACIHQGRPMKAILAAAILTCATGALAEEHRSYETLMAEARAAFEAEDWTAAEGALDAAQAERPYSLYLTRNRILVRTMLEDFGGAVDLVRQIADRGLSISLTGHSGFERLKARTEFAALDEQMAANLEPVGLATAVLEIDRDFLLPEAVAYAKIGKLEHYYVGAVRQGGIHVGEALHSATTGGVYGVKIADELIWTVENTAAPFTGDRPAGDVAGVYAYSLADGGRRCAIGLDAKDSLLGAIESTPIGLVASDSLTPRLFVIEGCDAKPRVLSQDPRFINLQGIAYDKRRKKLYVADYLAGLFAIDLKSGAVAAVANDADAHLGGIDGLYTFKGDLIGIQNGTTPQRIVRLHLNRAGDTVRRLDVLQQNLPEWNEPTNGVIVGDDLVYVATSNWPAYSDDGSEIKGAQRKPLRLMSVRLD